MGSEALCCTMNSKSLKSRGDEMLERYGDIIDNFLEDPTCPTDFSPGDLLRRDAMWYSTGNETG